jgi:hypothetical protein
MYLLRKTSKGSDQVCLVKDFEVGARLAREFVGDHNPVDGCSTVPTERGLQIKGHAAMSVGRYTSFGHRGASVMPISEGVFTELVR